MDIRGYTINSPPTGQVQVAIDIWDVSGDEISLFEMAMLNRLSLTLDLGNGPVTFIPYRVGVRHEEADFTQFTTYPVTYSTSSTGKPIVSRRCLEVEGTLVP